MDKINYVDDDIVIYKIKSNLINENSYVIEKGKKAIVIDPNKSDELISLLCKYNTIDVILTHEHYDHICGVNDLKKKYACTVYTSKKCSCIISDDHNNTRYFPLLFINDRNDYNYIRSTNDFPYTCYTDVSFDNILNLRLSNMDIVLWETPGHSPGGISIIINNKYLFSGDNLLGNNMELKSIDSNIIEYKKTINNYYKLPHIDEIIVFPGHGKIDSLKYYLSRIEGYNLWN